jgi:NAD(P)H-flavin reductase
MTQASVDPFRPQTARIARVKRETADVVTLTLDASFAFEPGQFNMLYAFGVGEIAVSISGDPQGDSLEHTVRSVGAASRAIAGLVKGDTVGVRGPYGRGWPIREAEGGDLLIVAGGVGLCPLKPVMHHVIRNRARFGRVALLYGARNPEDRVYSRELARWDERDPGIVHSIVDHAGRDWRGRVGVVPALLDALTIDAERTTAMLCGPEVMMRFAARALARCGVRPERTYVSMERNMKCAIGVCGHCQYVDAFVCKDGPVFRFDRVAWLFDRREI